MIYTAGKNDFHIREKEEIIKKLNFSNVAILCGIDFISKVFIEKNLLGKTRNFLIFEKNGNLLEDLIDDFVVNKSLLNDDLYHDITTTTYDNADECLFMLTQEANHFAQEANHFGADRENNNNHLVFYDGNHFRPGNILHLVKKYVTNP